MFVKVVETKCRGRVTTESVVKSHGPLLHRLNSPKSFISDLLRTGVPSSETNRKNTQVESFAHAADVRRAARRRPTLRWFWRVVKTLSPFHLFAIDALAHYPREVRELSIVPLIGNGL